LDALELAGEHLGPTMPKVAGEGSRADYGTVVELYLAGLARRSNQPTPLKTGNRVQE